MTAKELIAELSIDCNEPNTRSGEVTQCQREFAEENIYTLAEVTKKAIRQRDQALCAVHELSITIMKMKNKKMPAGLDIDCVIHMANVELDKIVEGT